MAPWRRPPWPGSSDLRLCGAFIRPLFKKGQEDGPLRGRHPAGAFNVTGYRSADEFEPALTRAELVAIRGPDLRPVPKPDNVKRLSGPDGHGTRYRWLKGCRCRWCHRAAIEYNQKQDAKRLREANQ